MKLILAIRTLPLQPFQYGEFEGKRRIARSASATYDLRKLQPNRFRPGWRKSFGNVETVNPNAVFGTENLLDCRASI
jgi:hypothetical protein